MMTVDVRRRHHVGRWLLLDRSLVEGGGFARCVWCGRDVRVRYLCPWKPLPDTRSADSGRVREEESREDAKRPGAQRR